MNKIPFIITIDTEGDNLWSNPTKITTENSKYLPRFQELCEKYGFKPVYLTNWEMANCPVFIEFARDVIKRKKGEIGMHLHAWNSPPLTPLTKNDFSAQPFLLEYPFGVMRKKIEVMTKTLEDIFQVPITSHRAGRWAINSIYFKLLKEFGYKVDCSVTPYVNWGLNDLQYEKNNIDYSAFSPKPYFVDDNLLSKSESDILEVPVTIIRNPKFKNLRLLANKNAVFKKVFNHYNPELLWLRPNGKNLKSMINISNTIIDNEIEYAEFILHSSEIMPGGSPTFTNSKSIEKLYYDLDIFFSCITSNYNGITLNDFHKKIK